MEESSPSPPFTINIAIIGVIVTFSILVFHLSGAFGLLLTFQDYHSDGELEEQTLGDYDPIQTMQVTNSTLHIQTEPTPQHESRSPLEEHDVTHLRLTRDIGGINSVNEVLVGQQQYSFTLPQNAQTGNYTLTLEARKPPDPGLFGHPKRTDRQVIVFTITEDDEVNVKHVPYKARYS